jgi:hypothetical protein
LKVLPQKCLEVSTTNEKGNKRPLHCTSSPKHAEEGRVRSLRDHHHSSLENMRETTRHSQFLEKLIMATGTSVLATQSLMGLGAAETTEPRKWSKRFSSPLLLANLLPAPAVGRTNTGFGHHKQPLEGRMTGATWLSQTSLSPSFTLLNI